MLSKPNCGTTEFQFEETVKYTLIGSCCDIPFEWVDAAIDGLRRKREFTVLGYTDADEDRVHCIVSRWNCHVIWEADIRAHFKEWVNWTTWYEDLDFVKEVY